MKERPTVNRQDATVSILQYGFCQIAFAAALGTMDEGDGRGPVGLVCRRKLRYGCKQLELHRLVAQPLIDSEFWESSIRRLHMKCSDLPRISNQSCSL
ncbi:unnamed protein product, partial [Mycena citricolor]